MLISVWIFYQVLCMIPIITKMSLKQNYSNHELLKMLKIWSKFYKIIQVYNMH